MVSTGAKDESKVVILPVRVTVYVVSAKVTSLVSMLNLRKSGFVVWSASRRSRSNDTKGMDGEPDVGFDGETLLVYTMSFAEQSAVPDTE